MLCELHCVRRQEPARHFNFVQTNSLTVVNLSLIVLETFFWPEDLVFYLKLCPMFRTDASMTRSTRFRTQECLSVKHRALKI